MGKFCTNLCDRKPVLVLPDGNQEIAHKQTRTAPRNACKQKHEVLHVNMKEIGVINMIKMSAGKTIICSYCKQPKRQSLYRYSRINVESKKCLVYTQNDDDTQ